MIRAYRSFSMRHVAIGIAVSFALFFFARLTLLLKRRELEQPLKALCTTPAALLFPARKLCCTTL
jgi:hypothetical protein